MAELTGEIRYRNEFLVTQYRERENRSWESLRAAADQTSQAVQELTEAVIESDDRIGDDELTALFRCCQHTSVVSTSRKRELVQELGLPEETATRITDQITDNVGSVGGRLIDLHVGGKDIETPETERALHSSLATLVTGNATAEDRLDAVERLVNLEYHNVQSGRMSPILHYLHPTEFPVINGRSRAGMEQYFDREISSRLIDYLDERETYRTVRNQFKFAEHYRDLDWFFNWADQEENIWTEAIREEIEREVWQAQPGTTKHSFPEKLWPIWQDQNIISIGYATDPGEDFESQEETIVKRMAPGDIVVAKAGHHNFLGLGVVTTEGHERLKGDEAIEFANNGEDDTHPHIRHVEWVYTRSIDDSIQVDTYDVSTQFDTRTLVRYKPFNELRAKFTADPTLSLLAEFAQLEKTSLEYARGSEYTETTETNTGNPTVWIEKTKVEGRPYKQEGELKLGNALIAPSRDEGGGKRYETLREADVGDIVLHLIQEQYGIVGVSVIESELQEDFDGPPDDRWTDKQQQEGGYLRWLSDFEGIEPHIHIYDDILENETHKAKLQQIRNESEKIFYTKRLSLNQGHYFTRCPDDLVDILIEESGTLGALLAERGYGESGPTEYDGIAEATADILDQLGGDTTENLVRSELLEATVSIWTDVLRRNALVENQIQTSDIPVLEEIISMYDELQEQLAAQAAKLHIGQLDGVSSDQLLFVVLIRQLQAEIGEPNFNHVKMQRLLSGEFRSERNVLETRAEPPMRGETIQRQLTRAKQLVFHGPPGTGKTYTAQEFARWWLGQQTEAPTKAQLEVVTFHPSFTYEDFIEGLTAKEQGGSVEYSVKDGVFKRFCERAREAYKTHREANPDTPAEAPPYVLIIDEINRGNLAQIFGEIITLLEPDKRLGGSSETTATLPHSSDRFAVPPNVYVIGTMNTADRSIALVDAALRRRFRFLHFPPEQKVLYEAYGFAGEGELRRIATDTAAPADALLALSILALDRLNQQIRTAPQLGRGKQLGHSYLLGIDRTHRAKEQIAEITDTWMFEILPLLEEYYFGQFKEIENALFGGNAGALLDAETQEIGNFTAEELAEVLIDLLDIGDVEWAAPAPGDNSETSQSDVTYTMDYLLQQGVLEVGDELHFNKANLPDDVETQFDPNDAYWRCTVTGNNGQQDGVRWNHDGDLYSISGLSRQMFEELTGADQRRLSGTDWWRHPQYDAYTLYDLREAVRTGEISIKGDEEAAADD